MPMHDAKVNLPLHCPLRFTCLLIGVISSPVPATFVTNCRHDKCPKTIRNPLTTPAQRIGKFKQNTMNLLEK